MNIYFRYGILLYVVKEFIINKRHHKEDKRDINNRYGNNNAKLCEDDVLRN